VRISKAAVPERIRTNSTSPTKGSERPKVYVLKACVNCKLSHVACDVNRPCHRCVRLGKGDSCIDAERKKRGRPCNSSKAKTPRTASIPGTGTSTQSLLDKSTINSAPASLGEPSSERLPLHSPYTQQNSAPPTLASDPVVQGNAVKKVRTSSNSQMTNTPGLHSSRLTAVSSVPHFSLSRPSPPFLPTSEMPDSDMVEVANALLMTSQASSKLIASST
jgi:hypothetical protein